MGGPSTIGTSPRAAEMPRQTEGTGPAASAKRASVVEAGFIDVQATWSRADSGGEVRIPCQSHDIPPPGPNAAEGMKDLKLVITTNLSTTIDILAIVKAMMSEAVSVMGEIHQQDQQLMNESRKSYAHAIDNKVKRMYAQADKSLIIGLTTTAISGGFNMKAAYIGYRSQGANPQIVLAKSQGTSGLGHTVESGGNSVEKFVSTYDEATIAKRDKSATLCQSFQAEFKDNRQSAMQDIRSFIQALAEAGSKDDAALTVVIKNMG